METFIYLTAVTVKLVIGAIQLCMFVRAILSFLPLDDGPVSAFVTMLTEPVIYPVRLLCSKFGLGDGLPIDIPFFITFLLLSVLSMVL